MFTIEAYQLNLITMWVEHCPCECANCGTEWTAAK
jgi:hypothetical protein